MCNFSVFNTGALFASLSPDVQADDPPSALAVVLAHGLHGWRHVGLVLLVAGDGAGDHVGKNCAR